MTTSPRRLRAAVLLLAVATAATACASPVSSGQRIWDGGGVRFAIPAGWEVRASTMPEATTPRWLLYLATQPLGDDCAASGTTGCRLPLDALVSGGLLLAWRTTTCAGPACALPSGPVTQVGDRQAAVVAAGSVCGTIGETESTAYVVSVSPQRLDALVICARAPSDATRAALAELLAGIDWRTP